jgi:aminobenzoyl-glutamate utilization protein B
MRNSRWVVGALLVACMVGMLLPARLAGQRRDRRLGQLKAEVTRAVEERADFTADLVDQLFSFAELGFQETETFRFLVGMLRDSGFTVEEGVAGIPTAWVATWGSGKPVLSLGSDIDGIPAASQYPGVACRAPMIEGAPGHGEGHNSGLAVQITAALAVRAILARDGLPGTIRIWPGVAEELVGTKAYFVREGLFAGSDVTLFTHVDDNLAVNWGLRDGTGLVSVEYTFGGQAAHSAGAPWRGRSALDAVELMNAGWNYRREHLPLTHRSHYVITGGGDQPNVVPARASVWYYFRDLEEPGIRTLWAVGDTLAEAAARMAGVELVSSRVLGSAWPQHFNRPVAEAAYANITLVGLPQWTEADQALARAVQKLAGSKESGLATELDTLAPSIQPSARRGGGSDDIGDVTWTVPTVTLRFPSNIPGLPGHSWLSTIAMATPIAHKGATAGAKVVAMTMLDLALNPQLVNAAWSYFRDVQGETATYRPLIRPDDRPATHLNAGIMARYRDAMRPFYFDASRFGSYLEQLGVTYPTLPGADGACPVPMDGR